MKHTALTRLAIYCAAAITATAPGSYAEAGQEGAESAPANPPKAAVEIAPKGGRRETYPFRGVIATIDVQARRLTLEGRQTRRVIHVTETTRFEKHGKPVTFTELRVGESVGGTLRKTINGQEEALLVRLTTRTPPSTGEADGAEREKEVPETR